MTDHTLPERLRELLAKATGLPWKQIPSFLASDMLDGIEGTEGHVATCEVDHDALFIVEAINALPTLLDALDSLSADREVGREYLLLASYCGDDTENCTDQRPCSDCLAMCNIFDADGSFIRELGVPDPSPPIPQYDNNTTQTTGSLYGPGGVPARRGRI